MRSIHVSRLGPEERAGATPRSAPPANGEGHGPDAAHGLAVALGVALTLGIALALDAPGLDSLLVWLLF